MSETSRLSSASHLLSVSSDCLSPAYQRVLKVESTNRRPVLILGPLVEPIKDMLLREAPGKYCRCLPGEIYWHLTRKIEFKAFITTWPWLGFQFWLRDNKMIMSHDFSRALRVVQRGWRRPSRPSSEASKTVSSSITSAGAATLMWWQWRPLRKLQRRWERHQTLMKQRYSRCWLNYFQIEVNRNTDILPDVMNMCYVCLKTTMTNLGPF